MIPSTWNRIGCFFGRCHGVREPDIYEATYGMVSASLGTIGGNLIGEQKELVNRIVCFYCGSVRYLPARIEDYKP